MAANAAARPRPPPRVASAERSRVLVLANAERPRAVAAADAERPLLLPPLPRDANAELSRRLRKPVLASAAANAAASKLINY